MTGIREAIEAEWFNGNIAESCRDRLLAAADPTGGLTIDEQRQIVTAADKWRNGGPFDEHIGELFGAVERILAARTPADP